MRKKFDAVATVRKIRDAHYRKFKNRPLKEWFESMRSESVLVEKEIEAKKHLQTSHRN
ncbi:MAG: hypothetical protein HQL12_09315 [Candidatus Omnitrophica bacterium]|nr:hypothetical protein [Candidatus Omnitrophota bacterium]